MNASAIFAFFRPSSALRPPLWERKLIFVYLFSRFSRSLVPKFAGSM